MHPHGRGVCVCQHVPFVYVCICFVGLGLRMNFDRASCKICIEVTANLKSYLCTFILHYDTNFFVSPLSPLVSGLKSPSACITFLFKPYSFCCLFHRNYC